MERLKENLEKILYDVYSSTNESKAMMNGMQQIQQLYNQVIANLEQQLAECKQESVWIKRKYKA